MESVNAIFHTETITMVRKPHTQLENVSINHEIDNSIMSSTNEKQHENLVPLQDSNSFLDRIFCKGQSSHFYSKPRGKTTMPTKKPCMEPQQITESTVTPIIQSLTCTRCTNETILNDSQHTNVNRISRKRPSNPYNNNSPCFQTPARKRFCTAPISAVENLLDMWEKEENKTLMMCFTNYQKNRSRRRLALLH